MRSRQCGASVPAARRAILRVGLEPNVRVHGFRSSASARRLTSSHDTPRDSPAITRRARFSISAAHTDSTSDRSVSGSSRLASNSAATSARSSAASVSASRRSAWARSTSASRDMCSGYCPTRVGGGQVAKAPTAAHGQSYVYTEMVLSGIRGRRRPMPRNMASRSMRPSRSSWTPTLSTARIATLRDRSPLAASGMAIGKRILTIAYTLGRQAMSKPSASSVPGARAAASVNRTAARLTSRHLRLVAGAAEGHATRRPAAARRSRAPVDCHPPGPGRP